MRFLAPRRNLIRSFALKPLRKRVAIPSLVPKMMRRYFPKLMEKRRGRRKRSKERESRP